jgi:uncharacterized protein
LRNAKDIMVKIDEFLSQQAKADAIKMRNKIINDKIDITSFLVWFVENYPESEKVMRKTPDYQYNFK